MFRFFARGLIAVFCVVAAPAGWAQVIVASDGREYDCSIECHPECPGQENLNAVSGDASGAFVPATTLSGIKNRLASAGIASQGDSDIGYAYFLQFLWSYENHAPREFYQDLESRLASGDASAIILLDDLLNACRDYVSIANSSQVNVRVIAQETLERRIGEIAGGRSNRDLALKIRSAMDEIAADNAAHNQRIAQLETNLQAMGINRDCVYRAGTGAGSPCVEAPLAWFYNLETRRYTNFALTFDKLRQGKEEDRARAFLIDTLAILDGARTGNYDNPNTTEASSRIYDREKEAFVYLGLAALADGGYNPYGPFSGTYAEFSGFLSDLQAEYAPGFQPEPVSAPVAHDSGAVREENSRSADNFPSEWRERTGTIVVPAGGGYHGSRTSDGHRIVYE
ncbi:MAG: hypothetical protein HYT79_05000 [Elusimicrobia bacterium]|nr:hypothetical protein [Elusimicrobiota bacterium]